MMNSLLYCILLLLLPAVLSADDCLNMATSGNCSFYSDCMEKRVPCGPTGYTLGYADKYCIKFGTQIDCFNTQGQKWINNVRICLETALINSNVYKNKGTCQDILNYGFSTHPHCYLVNGFCSVMLGSANNLYCLTKVFDLSDFMSKLAVNQVYEVLKNCTIG
jgi:hypothetical protein